MRWLRVIWIGWQKRERRDETQGERKEEEKKEERRWEEKGRRESWVETIQIRACHTKRGGKKRPWPYFHLWSWSSGWRMRSWGVEELRRWGAEEELALEQKEALFLLSNILKVPFHPMGGTGLNGMFSLIRSHTIRLLVIEAPNPSDFLSEVQPMTRR